MARREGVGPSGLRLRSGTRLVYVRFDTINFSGTLWMTPIQLSVYISSRCQMPISDEMAPEATQLTAHARITRCDVPGCRHPPRGHPAKPSVTHRPTAYGYHFVRLGPGSRRLSYQCSLPPPTPPNSGLSACDSALQTLQRVFTRTRRDGTLGASAHPESRTIIPGAMFFITALRPPPALALPLPPAPRPPPRRRRSQRRPCSAQRATSKSLVPSRYWSSQCIPTIHGRSSRAAA